MKKWSESDPNRSKKRIGLYNLDCTKTSNCSIIWLYGRYCVRRSLYTTFSRIGFATDWIWNPEKGRRAIHYSTIVAHVHHPLPIIVILCVRNVVNTVLTKFNVLCKFPFEKEANCDFWAQRCILLSCATLEGHLSEQMHP